MDEKLKVVVYPDADGVVPSPEELLALAKAAGWSEDPGTGITVLINDERGAPGYEVVNPMPFAPPIGFEPTPPIEQLIRDRVQLEIDRLRDDDEIDDIVDAEDFDVPDELPQLETIYEFIAMEREAPAVKNEPTAEERARADADYIELVEKQRLLKKRHREAALKKAQEEVSLYGDDPPPRRSEEERGA